MELAVGENKGPTSVQLEDECLHCACSLVLKVNKVTL